MNHTDRGQRQAEQGSVTQVNQDTMPPGDPPALTCGGQDDWGTGDGVRRSELAIERRALRRHWPVPAAKRKEILGRQINIATHAARDADAVRAFKALLAAEGLDNTRLGQSGHASNVTVNVDVAVAAREAAVFGDISAFRAAAEHQAKQFKEQQQIADSTSSEDGTTFKVEMP
jgi:hypothetical protein